MSLDPGRSYAVADLLPHGPEMLLLDALVEYGDEHASCALTIGPASRFFELGLGVPAWVGVEYMAQVIGAYGGIERLQAGQAVEIGLLLGTRAYECEKTWFAPGTRLVVTARLLVRDATGVTAFACELGDGSDIWARAEIKAFQPDDIQEYLLRMKGEAP